LIYPGRLAVDKAGDVYINDASAVVRVTPDGILRQIRPGGRPTITSLAVDGAGNLYGGLGDNISSSGGVVRIAPDGSLQILAGAGAPGAGDGCTAAAPGVPLAIQARLSWPADLAADSAGNLYFAADRRVRKITRDGVIHTVAGGPGGSFGGDGGPAANAFLAGPTALALDSNGNLYFIDRNNNRVRRIDPAGSIQTVAGSGATAGQDPACVAASGIVLSQPGGLAADPDGNVYISDTGNHRILKLTSDGSLTRVSGTGIAGSSGDGGSAADAQLTQPGPLAFAFGNLYIGEGERIRYITPDGVIHTFYAPVVNPTGLALDGAGNVFSANPAGILELTPGGRSFFVSAFDTRAIVAGPAGEVYFSGKRSPLSRLDPDCAVTPLIAFGNDLGGIAVAPGGDLYVSDTAGNSIWRIPARAPGGASVPLSLEFAGIVNDFRSRSANRPTMPATSFEGQRCEDP
jgi:sugar lactone lactonase YvrE